MSEERRCQLKALLDELWGPEPGSGAKLTVVDKEPPPSDDVAELVQAARDYLIRSDLIRLDRESVQAAHRLGCVLNRFAAGVVPPNSPEPHTTRS